MLIKNTDKTIIRDTALKSSTYNLLKESLDNKIIDGLRFTSHIMKRDYIFEVVDGKIHKELGSDVAIVMIFNDINYTTRFWIALYNEYVLFLGSDMEDDELSDGHFPCSIQMALELKEKYSYTVTEILKQISNMKLNK